MEMGWEHQGKTAIATSEAKPKADAFLLDETSTAPDRGTVTSTSLRIPLTLYQRTQRSE